jgi:SAM-dependent methyltransferase
VSPFIAEYVLRAPVGLATLAECGRCGLRYFEERFDDGEMGALYAGYRGDSYFRVRRKHEFWYTRRHNEAALDETAIERRRNAILQRVTPHLPADSVRRVLDYGGDAGQLIPPSLGEERHVFELSDVAPVQGVRRIATTAELQPASYDLILMSHVLEHVAHPRELLTSVALYLRPTGALYIEVPWERYRMPSLHAERGTAASMSASESSPLSESDRWTSAPGAAAYRTYLGWLAERRRARTLVDFVSTALRVQLQVVPPLGFAKLHEHINFFHEASLRTVAEGAGLRVDACVRDAAPGALAPGSLYAVVARG